MKTTRTFKGSWFIFAMIVAIAVGELIAWQASQFFGFRLHPITVAFVSIGLVQVAATLWYDDADIG